MNQIQVALELDQLIQAGPTIFIKLEPEVVDFTRNASFDLVCLSKANEFRIQIDNENVIEVISLIKTALFEDKKINIIGWNLKNLFTYVLVNTGGDLEFECKILDLKLAECFVGIREKCPANFSEVVVRLKRLFADSSWVKAKVIHQRVYLPLLSRVIPDIEAEGVFDANKRQILFPYYEIEGQTGGRLSTQLAYENCFNPHSLSEEERSKLHPKGNGLSFLWFDYHFHEVCILAWLSQDTMLLELVSGEGDFYRKLYTYLLNEECDTDDKRAFCKDYLFLPVIYGQGIETLSERASVTIEEAGRLIASLKAKFKTLFAWIENHEADNSVYVDYIGRKRSFAEGEFYKYRNFIIQSPGAIFCLEKLVRLHDELGGYGKIVAHIHDAYVVRSDDKQLETVKSICLKVLEGESIIFPGLKLKTNCKISKTLA
jgi:DNA polymerase I-like protein with 3'-5' exonuclease and polymerase domains